MLSLLADALPPGLPGQPGVPKSEVEERGWSQSPWAASQRHDVSESHTSCDVHTLVLTRRPAFTGANFAAGNAVSTVRVFAGSPLLRGQRSLLWLKRGCRPTPDPLSYVHGKA
jgi:hypothetical protein